MLSTLKEIIGRVTTASPTNAELMSLAKTEYKTDWEWAYNALVSGKTPVLEERV